jgi:hypothetical protein
MWKAEPRAYAKTLVTAKEFSCLDHIWKHESNWNYKSQNKNSTAFGIPQMLRQIWVLYGWPINPKNPVIQVNAGLDYIHKRYGSACRAWAFWKTHNWY